MTGLEETCSSSEDADMATQCAIMGRGTGGGGVVRSSNHFLLLPAAPQPTMLVHFLIFSSSC